MDRQRAIEVLKNECLTLGTTFHQDGRDYVFVRKDAVRTLIGESDEGNEVKTDLGFPWKFELDKNGHPQILRNDGWSILRTVHIPDSSTAINLRKLETREDEIQRIEFAVFAANACADIPAERLKNKKFKLPFPFIDQLPTGIDLYELRDEKINNPEQK